MHLFLLNLEKVCCVCVCDLETSGEFFSFCKVLLHRIFFSSITMEKLVLFSLSFSLDFCWLGNYGMWRGVTRTCRADRSRRVTATVGWMAKRFVSMVERKTKRTRIVHGKKVVGNSGENEQNSTLFVRNKIAFFFGTGRIKPKLFCFEHHHHCKISILAN